MKNVFVLLFLFSCPGLFQAAQGANHEALMKHSKYEAGLRPELRTQAQPHIASAAPVCYASTVGSLSAGSMAVADSQSSGAGVTQSVGVEAAVEIEGQQDALSLEAQLAERRARLEQHAVEGAEKEKKEKEGKQEDARRHAAPLEGGNLVNAPEGEAKKGSVVALQAPAAFSVVGKDHIDLAEDEMFLGESFQDIMKKKHAEGKTVIVASILTGDGTRGHPFYRYCYDADVFHRMMQGVDAAPHDQDALLVWEGPAEPHDSNFKLWKNKSRVTFYMHRPDSDQRDYQYVCSFADLSQLVEEKILKKTTAEIERLLQDKTQQGLGILRWLYENGYDVTLARESVIRSASKSSHELHNNIQVEQPLFAEPAPVLRIEPVPQGDERPVEERRREQERLVERNVLGEEVFKKLEEYRKIDRDHAFGVRGRIARGEVLPVPPALGAVPENPYPGVVGQQQVAQRAAAAAVPAPAPVPGVNRVNRYQNMGRRALNFMLPILLAVGHGAVNNVIAQTVGYGTQRWPVYAAPWWEWLTGAGALAAHAYISADTYREMSAGRGVLYRTMWILLYLTGIGRAQEFGERAPLARAGWRLPTRSLNAGVLRSPSLFEQATQLNITSVIPQMIFGVVTSGLRTVRPLLFG